VIRIFVSEYNMYNTDEAQIRVGDFPQSELLYDARRNIIYYCVAYTYVYYIIWFRVAFYFIHADLLAEHSRYIFYCLLRRGDNEHIISERLFTRMIHAVSVQLFTPEMIPHIMYLYRTPDRRITMAFSCSVVVLHDIRL